MKTINEIKLLLKRLDGEPADALESEDLEIKPWEPRPAAFHSQVRELREAVVALANRNGGEILLGISDRKRSRAEAVHGVGNVNADDLRSQIHQGTDPSILVEIEELSEPEGRVLVVHVPRGLPPHTTTEGVCKIRMGKESRPMTGSQLVQLSQASRLRDPSAEIMADASLSDLDGDTIRTFRRNLETEGGQAETKPLSDEELLSNLGLIHGQQISFSAVLLLGTPLAIARFCPQHEVTFVRFADHTKYIQREDMKGPLLSVLDALRRLLEPHLMTTVVQEEKGFRETSVLDFDWPVLREAALNAVVHRDYFQRQAVIIALHPNRLEITNPGGFLGGITPKNILRHPSVHRNALLADVLQKAGLVNRLSIGVDRIYESMLRSGRPAPRYESDESHVKLILSRKVHSAFVRMVAERIRQGGREFTLDELLLLRACLERGRLERRSAAEALQLPEDQAAARLADLREQGYFEVRGRGKAAEYCYTSPYSDDLRGSHATDMDFSLDKESVRLRVEAVLAERGSLTNEDIRRLAKTSRSEAIRLMRALKLEDLARLEGRGRGARYVPGPALKVKKKGKKQK